MRGELVRVEPGRTRDQLIDHLLQLARRDPCLVVGFDFAFSLPAWFLEERGLASARELWALLATESLTRKMQRVGLARWLNEPEPPFWTKRRIIPGEFGFRRTELEVRSVVSRPKSVFQLIGGGQVGRGSLYGMKALHRLALEGFSIWPFDPPRLPLVVEIFPRLLTGGVTKSREVDRRTFLGALDIPGELKRIAAASEDAFDATVSALVMVASLKELVALPHNIGYLLEGRIWQPERVEPRDTRA